MFNGLEPFFGISYSFGAMPRLTKQTLNIGTFSTLFKVKIKVLDTYGLIVS